ncbi:hypothetical protein K432DRAFT_415179 [Lepidopterella palustris CBS 459.81]|uniref:Hydroxyacyl-thioester dehydratase type 2, mitochondrial n=1 Tax=Lepidopterella palustris CBS 459.81 TaxID=1314670 RepID=A0A8E2EFS3_9PEZI|nr:hypothetical protein K432DRAFT_415179 [Lepidopterella palustris CBS 459.81]
MTRRNLPLIYDDMTPRPSYNLDISLRSFLPPAWTTASPTMPELPAEDEKAPELPPAHHLVYFNPTIPEDDLLPDGTDPLQSPGEPFVRRMWAGGSLRFDHDQNHHKNITLNGKRWVCHEFIRDVQIKGKEGDEKVFVSIERRMASWEGVTHGRFAFEVEDTIRRRLWEEDDQKFGYAQVIERRNIVFMREKTPNELVAAAEAAKAAKKLGKMLMPQNKPDFTYTLSPTCNLLFRYSALTFNAHAIHLDPQYCREVEGHRNLLVHGPLTLTLLVTMLREHLKTLDPPQRVFSFDYRNLAPLYANEPLKLCCRMIEDGKYEVWAETPEGGIAIKTYGY